MPLKQVVADKDLALEALQANGDAFEWLPAKERWREIFPFHFHFHKHCYFSKSFQIHGFQTIIYRCHAEGDRPGREED